MVWTNPFEKYAHVKLEKISNKGMRVKIKSISLASTQYPTADGSEIRRAPVDMVKLVNILVLVFTKGFKKTSKRFFFPGFFRWFTSWGNGSWNPMIYDGFKNIQKVGPGVKSRRMDLGLPNQQERCKIGIPVAQRLGTETWDKGWFLVTTRKKKRRSTPHVYLHRCIYLYICIHIHI